MGEWPICEVTSISVKETVNEQKVTSATGMRQTFDETKMRLFVWVKNGKTSFHFYLCNSLGVTRG